MLFHISGSISNRNFFYTDNELFIEAYLMNAVVFVLLHLVISLLFFSNFAKQKLITGVTYFFKNPFFIGYLILSSVFLSLSVINYEWYETIIIHVFCSIAMTILLELLKRIVIKHYKIEFYILSCYIISTMLILVKIFYF